VRVDRNVSHKERDLVDAFQHFLWSEEAQKIFVRYGFRSVEEPLNTAFTRIEDPFQISDLGGWRRAKKEIVDGIWKRQVLAELKK